MKGTIRLIIGIVMVYFAGGIFRLEDTLTATQMAITVGTIAVGILIMLWGTLAQE